MFVLVLSLVVHRFSWARSGRGRGSWYTTGPLDALGLGGLFTILVIFCRACGVLMRPAIPRCTLLAPTILLSGTWLATVLRAVLGS